MQTQEVLVGLPVISIINFNKLLNRTNLPLDIPVSLLMALATEVHPVDGL
jgi:hypothetical protein